MVSFGFSTYIENDRYDKMNRSDLEIIAQSSLPTEFGDFTIYAFDNRIDGKEHIALVKGNIEGKPHVPVRIHSECFTGDVLGSLRCDCRDQLINSLLYLGKHKNGILIYLRQEGRGIGLVNKIRAYRLQEQGLDTVEANHYLGFPTDLRNYRIASVILKLFSVKSIKLLTNNPEKLRELQEYGLEVSGRIPLSPKQTRYNRKYLETKQKKLGHLLSII